MCGDERPAPNHQHLAADNFGADNAFTTKRRHLCGVAARQAWPECGQGRPWGRSGGAGLPELVQGQRSSKTGAECRQAAFGMTTPTGGRSAGERAIESALTRSMPAGARAPSKITKRHCHRLAGGDSCYVGSLPLIAEAEGALGGVVVAGGERVAEACLAKDAGLVVPGIAHACADFGPQALVLLVD